MNQRQAERLARLVTALLPHQGTAAVLGLSYKPDTDVIEEAQGILLIEQLLAQSISVVAHDPVAGDHARRRIPAARFPGLSTCLREADVIAITTPWDIYRSIPTQLGPEPPRAIIDCWRVLDPTTLSAITEYIVPGVGR